MALTARQLWIAQKIDTRMRKLSGAKDDLAILAAMAGHMSGFRQLLDTTEPGDMDELARKFPGFGRYANILETFAGTIQPGASPRAQIDDATPDGLASARPISEHTDEARAVDADKEAAATAAREQEGLPEKDGDR